MLESFTMCIGSSEPREGELLRANEHCTPASSPTPLGDDCAPWTGVPGTEGRSVDEMKEEHAKASAFHICTYRPVGTCLILAPKPNCL